MRLRLPPLNDLILIPNVPLTLMQSDMIFRGGSGEKASKYKKGGLTEMDNLIRNNRGQFIGGHKPLIRPKYELMKKYPKLICDTCYMRIDCPDYQDGSVCANKREFKKYINRDLNYVIEELCATTNISYVTMQYYFIKEIISGEYSHRATKLVGKNFKKLLLLCQIYIQVENSKSISNIKSKGIISKLFDFDTPL